MGGRAAISCVVKARKNYFWAQVRTTRKTLYKHSQAGANEAIGQGRTEVHRFTYDVLRQQLRRKRTEC